MNAKTHQIETVAAFERRQKMQLKIVRAKIPNLEDPDNFDEVGDHKVVLVDRGIDTYLTLKQKVLQEFFQGENIDE